jgi:RNA polymerase sigma factor (sigma-70 family)
MEVMRRHADVLGIEFDDAVGARPDRVDLASMIRPIDPDRALMRAVLRDRDIGDAAAGLRRAEARADRARNAVVMAFASRVPPVAKAYTGFSMTKEDQVHEGIIGLIRAVDRFDVGRGVRFWTYAFWRVRQACQRALTRRSRLVKITYNDVATLRDHDARERAGLPRVGGDVDIAMLRRIAGSHTVGWDSPVSGDESLLWSDVMVDPAADPDGIMAVMDARCIEAAMGGLTTREADVVRRTFGFHADEQTHSDVATHYGVSRQRISQIEAAALRKLRVMLVPEAQVA